MDPRIVTVALWMVYGVTAWVAGKFGVVALAPVIALSGAVAAYRTMTA